ncbi:MAG: chitobiase/beta-hexosaminidase C-terminal domain-containing protein, partial [Spirochaetaceae bacterium]|nr:chitobiase/beta-hexosaminidase C-terminal domain-containing protein [Spirochaetaceae bacterium]MCF7950424.1 chitobiase/beta-hexosaminidase C-terminal domain-containing protein [Spirochaetaceae bacterium]
MHIESNRDKPVQYRFSGSSDDTWLDYSRALHLSALSGEERTFTLQVRSQSAGADTVENFQYVIDRRMPDEPEIDARRQGAGYLIDFSVNETNTQVSYWVSSFETTEFKTWDRHMVTAPQKSVVKAYTVDGAGNRSRVVTKRLEELRPCASVSEIDLPSPVTGTFANAQWLVIPNAHCFEWVRYSLETESSRTQEAVYTAPVLIRSTGTINLKIQAKPYYQEQLSEKKVEFTVAEPQSSVMNAFSATSTNASGPVDDIRSFPFPAVQGEVELYYSLEDTPVSLNHPQLESQIPVKLAEGMKNYLVYRIGAYLPTEDRMLQYRFFYVIDERIPPNPQFHLSDTLPFRSKLQVELEAAKEAEIYYSTDGSTPDRFSLRYTGPFDITSNGNSDLGVIPVQAVARYPNGNSSEIVRKQLAYDRRAPSPPSFAILKIDKYGADIQVDHPDSSMEIVYAVGYGNTPPLQINRNSPVISRNLRIDFPFGFQGKAFVRFAAKDQAGNISTATATARVEVDSVPPAAPSIRRDRQKILIEGSSDLFYRLFYRNQATKDEFTEYTGPIDFNVENNIRQEIKVAAYAEDSNKNRSKRTEKVFVIDTRPPKQPQIISTVDRSTVNRPIAVRCIGPYTDSAVYYTLFRVAKGDSLPQEAENSKPGFADSLYSEPIRLSGIEEREVLYVIKARSYLPSAEAWSAVTSSSFTIDRKSPEPVKLEPIIGKTGLFSEPVTVQAEAATAEEVSWIYVVEEPSAAADVTLETVLSEGVPLSRGVLIEGAEGEEKRYQIHSVTVDKAGNSRWSETVELTIDRKKPEIPPLEGLPPAADTNSQIKISAPDGYQPKIIYELAVNQGLPPVPKADSPVLNNSPLVLSGTPESDSGINHYVISYRSLDQAGNMSPVKTEHIRISGIKPPSPQIIVEQIGTQLVFVQIDSEHVTYVKINDENYKLYTQGITFYQSTSTEKFKIEAYSQNSFGNRSDISREVVSFEVSNQPFIYGVEDGQLYTEDVHIKPAHNRLDVRYELASSKYSGDSLSGNSPKLFKPISIRLNQGQREEYRLSVGLYDKESDSIHSIQSYTFVIDKASPLPPRIVGIQPDYHYTEDQTIRFITNRDTTVYFRTRDEAQSNTSFRPYVQPEKVSVRPGTSKTIVVEAWAEDSAGNRSEEVSESFVIDKESIYVSQRGQDSFSGGKETPFRSIDRALYEASTSSRNTIYLAAGDYTVTDPISVKKELNIIGESPEETSLKASDEFNSLTALFTVSRGALKIENVLISNHNLNRPLVVQEGEYSRLAFHNSTILHTQPGPQTLIWSKAGELVLDKAFIEIDSVRNGSILKIDDSSAELRDSTIGVNTSYNSLVLLQLHASQLKISGTKLTAGASEKVQVINAENSDIVIENSSIDYGSSKIRATGIQQMGGRLTLKDTRIGNDNGSAHIAAGIKLENVDAEIVGATLNGFAELGIIQLEAKNSRLILRDSSFSNAGTQEFSYLMRLQGGSSSLSNTQLKADRSYNVFGIELRDRAAAMLQNSEIELHQGESSTYG